MRAVAMTKQYLCSKFVETKRNCGEFNRLVARIGELLKALDTIEAIMCDKEICGHFTAEEIRAVIAATRVVAP